MIFNYDYLKYNVYNKIFTCVVYMFVQIGTIAIIKLKKIMLSKFNIFKFDCFVQFYSLIPVEQIYLELINMNLYYLYQFGNPAMTGDLNNCSTQAKNELQNHNVMCMMCKLLHKILSVFFQKQDLKLRQKHASCIFNVYMPRATKYMCTLVR